MFAKPFQQSRRPSLSPMSILRSTICRNLIYLARSKRISNSRSFVPKPHQKCQSLLRHSIPLALTHRHFHCSNLLRTEESSSSDVDDSKVWAVFDPVTGSFVTTRTFKDRESTGGSENPKAEESAANIDENPRYCSTSGDSSRKSVPARAAGGVGSAVRKKSLKKRVQWLCRNCGDSFAQWWGTCPSCKAVDTVKEFTVTSENATRSWMRQPLGELRPRRLTDVNKGINPLEWMIPLSGLFGMEVARVLGGGLVPGSLVLVGGDPGVGKSTLLLQIAAMLAEGSGYGKPAPVVYVSGEESMEQIGNRAIRMRIGTNDLYLYSSTDIEDILEKVQALSPRALVVDSIQTVYLKGVVGSAGNNVQVKECTSALLRFAKHTNIPVLLIGHVTKTGDIAGPHVLEHIVDVVLYMEGEKYSSYRLLRSVKNRFGSTDELGVLEMSQSGLEAVSNPSEIFLSENYFDSESSDVLAGLAVAVVIDGSRSFLIEIQALCSSGSTIKKHVNGVQESRAEMIICILMKQAGLKLQDSSIFLNVVSGLKLKETAGDLAVAAAICSSFFEVPVPSGIAFIGEIGLGGELRTVARMDKRVITVSKLGYKKCIIPKSAMKSLTGLDLEGLEIIGCRNMKEVISSIFPF